MNFKKFFKKSIMKAHGFTLIETLIALAILASGLILLSQTWGGTTQRLAKAKINHEVVTLLEKKMVELLNKYERESFDSIPEEDSGDFGKDYSNYTWELKTKDFTMPDISGILKNNSDGADQNLLTIISKLSEHFSKVVKEFKLTLVYKAPGGRKLKWSLVTYIVNYDAPIDVSGGL